MLQGKEFGYYEKAADYVKSKINFVPELAIVLGTALGGLAENIQDPIVIDYKEIPNFLVSTVDSHAGKLILGELFGKKVVCMSGRFHYYEGYDFNELTVSIRLFKLLGVEKLILTNAAGAVNTGYRPGDVMIIRDHLNFVISAPTRGPEIKEFGPRFFDMSNAYDRELSETALRCSKNTSLRVHQGVYVYTSGPHFETPAEIKFYRMAGADAVGMSTVPEVITAAQCGLKTLGISLITNMAAGILSGPIDGKEVDEVGEKATKELSLYVKSIIESI